MPELPEVERAASLLRKITTTHPHVRDVEVVEDKIIYTGDTTHEDFARELKGRSVSNVGRYGKLFYCELDGEGSHPVFHFGMTGMLQVKGSLPVHYREAPRNASTDWPPKYMKFIIHFSNGTKDASTDILVAFLDPRRLGRIRLVPNPLTSPPISTLGFDPVLSMPPLTEFTALARKRAVPVKALLLDQAFSAGVGNWVADEILYHARIHPERRANALDDTEVEALWTWVKEVPRVAVELNAEDKRFPEDWLFKHRWGKGKKKKAKKGEEEVEDAGLKLPSGEPATIKFLTVGGRTSAYVAELQHLSKVEGDDNGRHTKVKKTAGQRAVKSSRTAAGRAMDVGDDELTPSGDEASSPSKVPSKSPARKRKLPQAEIDDEDSDALTPLSDEELKEKKPRQTRTARSKKVK